MASTPLDFQVQPLDVKSWIQRFGVEHVTYGNGITLYACTEAFYFALVEYLVHQIQAWCNTQGTHISGVFGVLKSGERPARDIAKALGLEEVLSFVEYHVAPLNVPNVASLRENRVGFKPVVLNDGISDWGMKRDVPFSEHLISSLSLYKGDTILIIDDQLTAGINTVTEIADLRKVLKMQNKEDVKIIHASITHGIQFPPKNFVDAEELFFGLVEDTYGFLSKEDALSKNTLPGSLVLPWGKEHFDKLAKKYENGAKLHSKTPRYVD